MYQIGRDRPDNMIKGLPEGMTTGSLVMRRVIKGLAALL
jgi:hypothetical protein